VAVPGPDHVYWQHMQTALSHCQHCGPVHVHYTVLCGLSRLLSSCGLQCRTAQSEAEKLRSQVEKLQHENRMLRMRLGEDAPKQEPVTPRMYPSPPALQCLCARLPLGPVLFAIGAYDKNTCFASVQLCCVLT